jgi:hypothetical protein
MTDSGNANQDPGQQPPASADEVLGDLMRIGGLLDGHSGREQQLSQALGGITTRRAELEAERTAAEEQIVNDFNAQAGALGMQRDELESAQTRLERQRSRAQRKVTKSSGRLRELADAPDAERSTVVTYAAFATTQPNFTGEAVERLAMLDEMVQEQADEPFVLVQDRLLAFGRIRKPNQGLLVNTDESAHRTEVVQLPLREAKISPAPHARKSPYYGWVSTEFDHPKYLEESYDSILSRYGQDDDVIKPDSYDMISHFSTQRGHLPLLRPAELRLAVPEDAELEADQDYTERAGIFFTNELAAQFLHRVVAARLTYITERIGFSEAMGEFGRLAAMSVKLGIAVDPGKIPELERLATM